jgi:predicted enzyme related to lactoylglutathione lyase
MPDRDGYIEGVPCWIDTSQPDPDAATEFYGGLFGWEFEQVMPPDAGAKYFIARIRGRDVAAISSQQPGGPPQPVWNTYVWVDSADATAEKVREAGGQVLAGPFDVFDAGRMAVCGDSEGAVFSVWQAGTNKGSGVVNEHGAVVFNGLNTRDIEGAKAFYGAVFGWQALDIGMWTLPGYGEFLERDNPGWHEQIVASGAPDGFADVVAAIDSIGDDQPDTPPHWNVTFMVDDADAAAETAQRLGGSVVVPPMDAPWVRLTVLTDSQGAMFVASKFVPENANLGR